MTKVKLTSDFLSLLLIFVLSTLVLSVFRFIFLLWFWPSTQLHTPDIIYALYLGLKFDARLSAIILLPLWLAMSCVPRKYMMTKLSQRIVTIVYTLAMVNVLIFYFVDFGYYSYIETRFNASVLKFLENIQTSLIMVWQSYPVVWGTLALILVFAACYYLMFPMSPRLFKEGASRKNHLCSSVLCFFILAGCIYGQLSAYPLRWSNAYFTQNTFITNLALNPVTNFFETLSFGKDSGFDLAKTRDLYSKMATYLNVNDLNEEQLNYDRNIEAKSTPMNNMNVVVIIMESLAWDKSSFIDMSLESTPFLLEFAKDSILFDNFYTPTTATARAVFATTTGIPDTSTVKTSSRNPLIVNQHMIINDFERYERFYFLGGSANWGNIRGVLQHNIENLQLYEEGSYESKVEDVWGISDLNLFREAHKVLVQQQKPFISVIQTSGLHRPYTIPEDNAGFTFKEVDSEILKKHGFASEEQEYQAFRFADHAIKEFFKLAKNSSYYENTVFAIFGDHGLFRSIENPSLPGYVHYKLGAHHVPLIIHAPKFLKPRVIHQTASQLDVMPTLASLVGIKYLNKTLGRDLFDVHTTANQGAFLYDWSAPERGFSFVRENLIYNKILDNEGIYDFTSKDFKVNLADKNMLEVFTDMGSLGKGFFETANYMMYNNHKPNTKSDTK